MAWFNMGLQKPKVQFAPLAKNINEIQDRRAKSEIEYTESSEFQPNFKGFEFVSSANTRFDQIKSA